jgi:hypothetical protein
VAEPTDRKVPDPLTKASDENVVQLSSYRARLARGKKLRRGDDLLDAPDPVAAVRALPPDEFFYLLAERGFPEALEILVHGSAPQVQAALDFALWDRDRLSPERTKEWFGALMEAPYPRIFEWVKGLDVELLAILIRRRAHIYELAQGEPEGEPEGVFYETPDRFFILDLRGDTEMQRITLRLVEALYASDLNLARRLLVGVPGELDAELEETAYRWRTGRMSDLGFVDYYEALEVYREIDPAQVLAEVGRHGQVERAFDGEVATDALRMPRALADTMGGTSLFARSVAAIASPSEVDDVHAALVSLSNRVLSADRVTPGQDLRIADTLARLSGTLDLAVEFLARGQEAQAILAVRTVPLLRIFKLGSTLVGKVGKLARALKKENPFSTLSPEIDLFEPEDAMILEALARVRPVFPGLLEQPPVDSTRPFMRLADVATATFAVERAAASLALLGPLGITAAALTPGRRGALGITDLAALDAGVLARTALVRVIVGHGPHQIGEAFRALTPGEVESFAANPTELRPRKDAPGSLQSRAIEVMRQVVPGGVLPPAALAVAQRWARGLDPLEPVLVASPS